MKQLGEIRISPESRKIASPDRSSTRPAPWKVVFKAGTGRRGPLLVLIEPSPLLGLDKSLQAQSYFSLRLIHLDDFKLHLLPGRQRGRVGFPARPAWDLREMAETFHSLCNLHKRAEASQPEDLPPNRIVDVMFLK